MKLQMKNAAHAHALPFSFMPVHQQGPRGLCTYLESLGCHFKGMWRYCCDCSEQPASCTNSGAELPALQQDSAQPIERGDCTHGAAVNHSMPWVASPAVAGLADGMYCYLPQDMQPTGCTPVAAPQQDIRTWSEYYAAVGMPLSSPAAALLHFPLTLYHALKLTAASSSGVCWPPGTDVTVHYLGGFRKSQRQMSLHFYVEYAMIT